MKIKGTEIQVQSKDVDFDLKGIYKEPVLTFTLDGIEIFKVEIKAVAVPSVSGANDTLDFGVLLVGTDGEVQTLGKQVHIPTFKAEMTPDEEPPSDEPPLIVDAPAK